MISLKDMARLEGLIRGQIVLPEDATFDEYRQVWNAMIDRRPAVIVRCQEADDIAPVVAFARENGLEISVRGAGHNIVGNAVCEGGMMIDLSGMNKVGIDIVRRLAYVEPGATLARFDEAAQRHGLATPVGINSTTGIAGLTLGGGFGWLTRKYGLTIDNLVSAEVVTADGKKLRVNEREHPDLFWALRGGGGNFGIVTQFEFRLHPLGPDVLAGLLVFPFAQARQVLVQYREYMRSAPIDLNVWVVLRKCPPLLFLPDTAHGREVMILPVFWAGDVDQGAEWIDRMREFGDLVGEHIAVQPYVAWQQAFDPLLTPGARNYWKSHNFHELNEGAMDSMLEFAATLPTPQCEIFLGFVGGAANAIHSEATAYAHRDARFVLNVHARWDAVRDDARCIAWAREFFRASSPYASAGAYVNFMTEDETSRVASAYGANYDRLRQVKQKYDPENVFHLNHNIKP